MPLYDFKCDGCFIQSEHFVRSSEKTESVICECGEPMRRVTMSMITIGIDRTPAVLLGNGRKVHGYFGKEAPVRRKQR